MKSKIVSRLYKENGYYVAEIYHRTPTMFMSGYCYTVEYPHHTKKEVIAKLRQEENAMITTDLLKNGYENDYEKLIQYARY